MTEPPRTKVQLPFPSLESLKQALSQLLAPTGLFIETQYPPAQGSHIDMSLLVGPERKSVATFLAVVEAPKEIHAGKKGVFLKFIELDPAALDFFQSLNLPFRISVESKTANSALILSPLETNAVPLAADEEEVVDLDAMEEEIVTDADSTVHLSDKEAAESQEQVQELMGKLSEPDQAGPSLAENLEHFARRPIFEKQTGKSVTAFDSPRQEVASSEDLSLFQGRGGYDMSDMIFGIDLGTCNSCVAVVQKGELKVLADDRGNRTTPSVVTYSEDGTVIVGREAYNQMTKNPRTSIFGAKRFIGRHYHSPVVQNMIPYFPYKLVPDENNHTAIDIFGKAVSLEQVSAEILKYMVSVGQSAINETTDKVIITVPAYYSDNQRQAVKDAGTLAGLTVVRIVNEPTAAAVAVGFNQKMNKRLLIYDLGGGTFDVSILEIKDNTFHVVATGGDTFLGGEDFDNRLVKWVLETSREEGILLARNPVTFERVKQACEKAKRELTNKRESAINLPYIQTHDGKTMNFQKKIDRETLVNLTRDLVEKTLIISDTVLSEAKLTIQDVDEVVLVGGMSQMPFVHNSVHQHYGKQPYGKVNPDEAVAMGAALLGGQLSGNKKVDLVDVLSMSVGIALPRNRFKPILLKNTQVPCLKKYRISADLSSDYTIDIFQGDSQTCDQNEYLGTIIFSDEVRGGNAQTLEIEFSLSPECLLNCIVSNPATGKAEKAVLVTHDTPPSSRQ